jgi:hypothetical protein
MSGMPKPSQAAVWPSSVPKRQPRERQQQKEAEMALITRQFPVAT